MSERLKEFEQWGEDVIFGRAKGLGASLMRLFLRGASWLFRGLVTLRLNLFKRGWKQQAQLGTMVISIGNITMGGTGKTPVVELFARTLRDRGRKVSILSRGYKSKALDQPQEWVSKIDEKIIGEEAMPKVVSCGQGVKLDVQYAGDEPYMLAKKLSKN